VVAKQCLSMHDHDFSMLDSDVPLGPGAAISSFDFNMGSCSSTTNTSSLSNVDSLDYESLADVLMSVQNLTKDSLISLAQAHSISFPLKCTVTNLWGIISNHLSRGLCAIGSSDACTHCHIRRRKADTSWELQVYNKLQVDTVVLVESTLVCWRVPDRDEASGADRN
jgi:hypothetical protein